MTYAFHIVFGDMAYETWQMMCTEPESAEKQAGQWGPKNIGQSGSNNAVILAQISHEKKINRTFGVCKKNGWLNGYAS